MKDMYIIYVYNIRMYIMCLSEKKKCSRPSNVERTSHQVSVSTKPTCKNPHKAMLVPGPSPLWPSPAL